MKIFLSVSFSFSININAAPYEQCRHADGDGDADALFGKVGWDEEMLDDEFYMVKMMFLPSNDDYVNDDDIVMSFWSIFVSVSIFPEGDSCGTGND